MKYFGIVEAKAHLSALIAEVVETDDPVAIKRRGRPVSVLVTIGDLGRIGPRRPAVTPRGALALVGAWREMGDEAIDEFIADIYRAREATVSDSGGTAPSDQAD